MSLKWKLLLSGLTLEIVGFYLREPAVFLPGVLLVLVSIAVALVPAAPPEEQKR